MGHTAGRDIFRRLGEKIDGLTVRVPWNENFHAILRELYTEEEAGLVVRMPYGLATMERLVGLTGLAEPRLRTLLDQCCAKGLVLDLWLRDSYMYAPSPLVIGIFEFTMMRTGAGTDSRRWARLFHDYMQQDDTFYAANYGSNEKIAVMRTLPHEEMLAPEAVVEVLDYEKAAAIVDAADRFSMGLCSCRHERHHLDEKKCDTPLDNCTSMGIAADYLVRNNLAREVTRSEVHENLARSKELGLVLNADNVRKNISFICHCCKCCCNALAGISKFGFPATIVTSSYIAEYDGEKCNGCGKCARACPVNGVAMRSTGDRRPGMKKRPVPDDSLCLGCGVCGLHCETGAIRLVRRGQRVLHPETVFEKNVLAALERGNLQNLIFDNADRISHRMLRGLVGAFYRIGPVKRALMSDLLRSSFLRSMKAGARLQGKGWLTEL